MGHVDTLTQIEVQSHSEQDGGVIGGAICEVLAGAVAKSCTVEEGDVVEGDVDGIDEGQSSVCAVYHRASMCTSEGLVGKVLERRDGPCEGVASLREHIVGGVLVALLEDPSQVSARRWGVAWFQTFWEVLSSGGVDIMVRAYSAELAIGRRKQLIRTTTSGRMELFLCFIVLLALNSSSELYHVMPFCRFCVWVWLVRVQIEHQVTVW